MSHAPYRLEPFEANAASLNDLQAWMREDFPPLERLPSFSLKRALRRGVLRGFWLTGAGGHIGYILYHVIAGLKVAHIMYFAVSPGFRGGGVGSLALRLLREKLPGLAILLEVEDPEAAHGVDERLAQERRVEFYQRNGFALIPASRLDFFSVPLVAMADRPLPVEDWEKLYRVIYHRMLGAWLPTKLIRKKKRAEAYFTPACAEIRR